MRVMRFDFGNTGFAKDNRSSRLLSGRRIRPILAGLAVMAVLAGCRDDLGPYAGSGTLELRESRLGAQVAGVVLEVRPEEGDSVRVGDTLVVLDTVARGIQRDQAIASAEAARAAYELALHGSRPEDIEQASAQLEAARAQLAGAKDDFERIQSLAGQGAATQAQFESAKSRLDAARAQVRVSEQGEARLRKGTRSEDIARARAQWKLAEAQLAAARDQLDRSIVRAPAGAAGRWVVTERLVEPGEMVQPGGQVATVADPRRADLRIYLGETAIAAVRPGQKAAVRLDGAPDRELAAVVANVARTAEFTPKNVQTAEERAKLVYAVTLRVENDGSIKSGMPATARIEVGR